MNLPSIVFFCLISLAANAAALVLPVTVTSQIGDADGLGLGLADGAQVPFFPVIFDNRSPSEATATNGAQFTDISNTAGGLEVAFVDFVHTYEVPQQSNIQRATLTFGLGGLEGNFEDALFIDGLLIPFAFSTLNQGGFEFTAAFKIELPTFAFSALTDGQAIARIDPNVAPVGGGGGEPIFLDYSRLDIVFIPEPNSMPLMLSGFALILLGGRRWISHKSA